MQILNVLKYLLNKIKTNEDIIMVLHINLNVKTVILELDMHLNTLLQLNTYDLFISINDDK